MVEQKERTRLTQSEKNCAIQGVRLIWKKKKIIGHLWVSLIIDQSECLVCFLFFHWINSFRHCLEKKKTALLLTNQNGDILSCILLKMKRGILYRARELNSSICYTSVESAQCTLSKDELRWVDHAIYTLDWWCPRFCNGYKFWGRNLPEQTKFLYCIDILLFIYHFFFMSLSIWFPE